MILKKILDELEEFGISGMEEEDSGISADKIVTSEFVEESCSSDSSINLETPGLQYNKKLYLNYYNSNEEKKECPSEFFLLDYTYSYEDIIDYYQEDLPFHLL